MERIRGLWRRWRNVEEGQRAPALDELMLSHYPGAVMLLDDQGVVLQVNPAFERHTGHAPDQLLGRRAVMLDIDPLHGDLGRALSRVLDTRRSWQGVLLCRRADGALRHQTTMIQPLETAGQGPLRLLVMQYDVTGMRERELHERQLLARLDGTVSRLPGAIFRLHQSGKGRLELIYASSVLETLTGISSQRAMDDIDCLLEGLLPEGRSQVEAALAQSSVTLEPCQLEIAYTPPHADLRWLEARATPLRRRDGSTLWDGLLIDITERKRVEQQVRRLVGTDMLTGALNRRAFFEQGAAAQARASRHGQPLPLAMLDLDHFKALNDTHGHATGDLALQAFAWACREELRPYDLFARIGGEEFAVLLVDISPDEARTILERLRRAVEALELEVEEAVVRLTVSIGFTLLAPEASLEAALGEADRALYRAKHEGRNRLYGPAELMPGADDADPA